MSEWHLVSMLVGFVGGFVSGLIYALRLYRSIEADSDREWAKRKGMPEFPPQQRDLPLQANPILRRRSL